MKKIYTLFIGLFFLSGKAAAGDFHVDIPSYDKIDYACNQIRIPGGDSIKINAFFQKFDSLFIFGTGRINILHIGGSHVQADFFSNQVRRNLDEINRGSKPPRGFIFPYNVAKTNNPLNYKVQYKGKWNAARNVRKNREIPLGMGGIAVYTSDPEAEISVRLNVDDFDYRWNFDKLMLIGYVEDGSDAVKPVLKNDDGSLIEPIFDNVSKTYHFELPLLTDSFTVSFEQEDAVGHTFVLNGFIPGKDEAGIVYHAIGVNGASVPSYLDCEYFEDELALIPPDLVIFEIGINDASAGGFSENNFIYNYNLLVERIMRVSPDAAFIFITNNDSYRKISKRKYAVNKRGAVVQKAFYTLAEQHQGGVWDLFSIMGGLGSMKNWESYGLAKSDKVHFTKEGYELIGDLFYNALMDYYLQQNNIDY
jgi:lysophospholipase L1-like esterase